VRRCEDHAIVRSRRHSLLAAALAGSLLAAGCVSVVRDPARPSSAPASRPPPVSGTTRASGSYVMSGEFSPRSFRPGGMRAFTVSKLSPPLNSMEPFPSALTAVLVFPLIPQPASCLQQVRLRLRVLGGQGPIAELAIYPSALLSLAKGRRPDRIPLETLIDNRPRGLADVPLDVGWVEIDLTELYRTWADGGAFPSMGRTIPKGTPLVVSIRPPAWTNENDFVREFAGAAAGRAAPRLAWTASGACRR
jgi:hypothetical protein